MDQKLQTSLVCGLKSMDVKETSFWAFLALLQIAVVVRAACGVLGHPEHVKTQITRCDPKRKESEVTLFFFSDLLSQEVQGQSNAIALGVKTRKLCLGFLLRQQA